VRYGEGLANYSSPIEEVDLTTLALTGNTALLATLTDAAGAAITITGTGLKYKAGAITGGTITAIEVSAPGGDSLFSITGISEPAAQTYAFFVASGDLNLAALGGDDRIYGSSKGNLLLGGGGNDRVFGGGGRDFMAGMDGRDQLTGGKGSDVFVFVPNKGVDKIMDFADAGLAGDDFIAVRPRQMENMVMTQQGDDVLLTFGTAGSLLVLKQTLAEMGADDFWAGGPLPV